MQVRAQAWSGISVMEQSVPTAELIHLSLVRSELLWQEDTIIKCLQPERDLKSMDVDSHTDSWWVAIAHC